MSSGKSTVSLEDLKDLHGKVAIVTGGNTGIGYATVQSLARKGAKVYMAARDEGRAMDAIKKLETEGIADGSVHWLKLDLSDPRLARQSAEEFTRKETRLDILVNNAARGAFGPYDIDKDGLLDIMVTNHISHFVFTDTLLPVLKTTAQEADSDVRIINITSIGHERCKVTSFADKESLNRTFGDSFFGYVTTYGHSKLANILHIKELQRRLDTDNIPITCMSVHPGAVRTVGANGFLANTPYIGGFLLKYIGPLFFTTWEKGAMTSVFAAGSPEVKEKMDAYKGAYLVPVAKIADPSKYATDERLAKELWETTERVVAELK
ncbi:NAD-P-binding protein [Cyathus striatus]|nr:NAD-P-binding protein [Cyathus striatus]